jgi:hypothetical protein
LSRVARARLPATVRASAVVLGVLGGVAAACATGPGPEAFPPPEAWWSARFADADTLSVTELAAGASHVYLRLPAGPWAVHVVDVDESRCEPEVAALKAGPPLAARALTTHLGADALAAVNADFFMTPGGTPVGAHVEGGRVLVGPGARPLYAMDHAGAHWAGPGELRGFVVAAGDSVPLAQLNRPLAGGRHHPVRPGVGLFDEWYGDTIPAAPAGATVRRRDGADTEGVVVATGNGAGPMTTDAHHVALRAEGAAAEAWLGRLEPGDTVRWWARVDPAGGSASRPAGGSASRPASGSAAAPADGSAAEAVGGFPMLVEHGRGVYDEQTGVIATFGPVRHPRTAVAWDEARRRFFWVVVDGRQAPYSDGMSLPELEWLLLRLGASHAINLDGGGSTALVLDGRLANRPSDAGGEREVASVLALQACRSDR